MKAEPSAEPANSDAVRPKSSNAWVWACALAGIVAIVVVYYFAFSAAHAAQIRDVPLATKGGKP